MVPLSPGTSTPGKGPSMPNDIPVWEASAVRAPASGPAGISIRKLRSRASAACGTAARLSAAASDHPHGLALRTRLQTHERDKVPDKLRAIANRQNTRETPPGEFRIDH